MTNYQEVNFKKIPTAPAPEEREWKVEFLEEALVDPCWGSGGAPGNGNGSAGSVGAPEGGSGHETAAGNHMIICESAYYAQGIKGAVDRCLVRESVAKKLSEAVKLLPDGYGFKLYDTWRPYEVQYSLYYNYFGELADTGKYEDYTVRQLRELTKTFVSLPKKGGEISFVHSTGGAVDLTIVDEKGRELDMGSGFDEFSEKSNTDYYEVHDGNETVRANRRLLYHVMTECGFTSLPSEWWHFDYGDKFWAFYTGEAVLYRSLYEIPEEFRGKLKIHS